MDDDGWIKMAEGAQCLAVMYFKQTNFFFNHHHQKFSYPKLSLPLSLSSTAIPGQGGFTFSATSLFVYRRRMVGICGWFSLSVLFFCTYFIWKNERAIASSLRDDIEQESERVRVSEKGERVRLKHKYVHIAAASAETKVK